MADPSFVAAGTAGAGSGDVTPGMPAGATTGDLLLLHVASDPQDAVPATPSGWTVIPGASHTVTASHASYRDARHTLFYAWHDAGINRTVTDTGARTLAVITAWRDVNDTTPFDLDPVSSASSAFNTAVSVTGLTTVTDGAMVVAATCGINLNGNATYGSWANASLASITEAVDVNYVGGAGNNTGIAIAYGTKATAGAVSATTATSFSSTVDANWCIALRPAVTETPVTPAPVTVTVTPGTVTVTTNTPIAATGATVTVTPGTATVTTTVDVTPTGATVTVTPGAVELLQALPVDAAGATVTVTPGTVEVTLTDQGIAPTGASVTVTPGTATVTTITAVTPQVTTVTVTPGSVEVVLKDQAVTLASATVTVVAGTTTITMPALSFTPPTYGMALNPERPGLSMWRLHGAPIRVGYSVIITGGVATPYPGVEYPLSTAINAADAGSGEGGLAWFRGGIEYEITPTERTALEAAGYTTG